MKPLTPQKPQRSTVSRETTRLSLSKSDRNSPSSNKNRGDGAERQYPGTALGLMLVVGVLLGLLLAAVISSLVGGSSGASGKTPDASTSSSITGQKQQDRRTQQRTDTISADKAPESRDIQILGCGTDADGYASARVLITNSTSKRSTYYVRVIFAAASDGRTISDDVASVKHLLPGATAPLQDVAAVDAAPGEQVVCRLGAVSRF